MTQTALCLIADDLTGALDAAAPFASPHAPVRLGLYPWLGLSQYAKVACSTESRDRTEAGAIAQVVAAYKALAKGRPQSTLCVRASLSRDGAHNAGWTPDDSGR